MQMSQVNIDYRTPDLCLANTLSLVFPLTSTQKENGRVFFCFTNSPELRSYVQQYWSDSIQVEPKRFFNQIKLLKGYIYGGSHG